MILMAMSDWMIGALVLSVQNRRACACCGGGPPWGESDICIDCEVTLARGLMRLREEQASRRVRERVQRIARAQERRDAWPQVG